MTSSGTCPPLLHDHFFRFIFRFEIVYSIFERKAHERLKIRDHGHVLENPAVVDDEDIDLRAAGILLKKRNLDMLLPVPETGTRFAEIAAIHAFAEHDQSTLIAAAKGDGRMQSSCIIHDEVKVAGRVGLGLNAKVAVVSREYRLTLTQR